MHVQPFPRDFDIEALEHLLETLCDNDSAIVHFEDELEKIALLTSVGRGLARGVGRAVGGTERVVGNVAGRLQQAGNAVAADVGRGVRQVQAVPGRVQAYGEGLATGMGTEFRAARAGLTPMELVGRETRAAHPAGPVGALADQAKSIHGRPTPAGPAAATGYFENVSRTFPRSPHDMQTPSMVHGGGAAPFLVGDSESTFQNIARSRPAPAPVAQAPAPAATPAPAPAPAPVPAQAAPAQASPAQAAPAPSPAPAAAAQPSPQADAGQAAPALPVVLPREPGNQTADRLSALRGRFGQWYGGLSDEQRRALMAAGLVGAGGVGGAGAVLGADRLLDRR